MIFFIADVYRDMVMAQGVGRADGAFLIHRECVYIPLYGYEERFSNLSNYSSAPSERVCNVRHA